MFLNNDNDIRPLKASSRDKDFPDRYSIQRRYQQQQQQQNKRIHFSNEKEN